MQDVVVLNLVLPVVIMPVVQQLNMMNAANVTVIVPAVMMVVAQINLVHQAVITHAVPL